jgi:hypothetical protein
LILVVLLMCMENCTATHTMVRHACSTAHLKVQEVVYPWLQVAGSPAAVTCRCSTGDGSKLLLLAGPGLQLVKRGSWDGCSWQAANSEQLCQHCMRQRSALVFCKVVCWRAIERRTRTLAELHNQLLGLSALAGARCSDQLALSPAVDD